MTLFLSAGLYFHIGETERKCFIEEIPDETMVTGNYKVQLYDPRTNGFAASSPEIGRTELISSEVVLISTIFVRDAC